MFLFFVVVVVVLQNRLHLNEDETDTFLMGFAPGIDLPSSLRVGQSNIPFSSSACSARQYLSLAAIRLLVPPLLPLGLIIVMLSLPALFQFSLMRVNRGQLLSSLLQQSSKICPHHSFTLWSPLATHQQPDSVQNSSLSCFHTVSGIAV